MVNKQEKKAFVGNKTCSLTEWTKHTCNYFFCGKHRFNAKSKAYALFCDSFVLFGN